MALDVLGAAAADPEPLVRMAAVEALGRIPGEAVEGALVERLADPNAAVADAAVDALAGRDPSMGAEEWMGELGSENPAARMAAMAVLHRLAKGGAKGAADLKKAVEEARAAPGATPSGRLAAGLLADAWAADTRVALAYWRALFTGSLATLGAP